jgi:hypothetical protein
MALTAVQLSNSFLSIFQVSIKENLDKGILNGKGLEDQQKTEYEPQISLLCNCDLEFFKTYITTASGEVWSLEYEVLYFICKHFHFNTNRNDCESAFKLLINCIYSTITQEYLEGVNILKVLYIQMLLESFPETLFGQEIMEVLNHLLDISKKQEFAEPYRQFYDFKMSLTISPGNSIDCSNFSEVKTTNNPFYLSPEKANRFVNFLLKHYKGLQNFVTEL